MLICECQFRWPLITEYICKIGKQSEAGTDHEQDVGERASTSNRLNIFVWQPA